MPPAPHSPGTPSPNQGLDREAEHLLAELVHLDTTNLEDPGGGRIEKRNYAKAAEVLLRRARDLGLEARVWDAREELKDGSHRFAEPRPNVIVDLNRGQKDRLLIVSHFDVVPVPDEQLTRWKSPPHELTRREDGRYYGRGAADDLGSGVVPGLLALRDLARRDHLRVNVRMIACCDEETGGAGGIEALREHDAELPSGSPEAILSGLMTVIPDGSPYVAAGSSGVSFVDVSLPPKSRVTEFLRVTESLTEFRTVAASWVSALPSPPEPEGTPPNAHITGRATLTLTNLRAPATGGAAAQLTALRSASLAANQIPAVVKLSFAGKTSALGKLESVLTSQVRLPFQLRIQASEGELVAEVVGRSGHGGYPHRAHNPVPESARLLLEALQAGALEDGRVESATMTLDLRSPPEMEAEQALEIFRNYFRQLENEVAGVKADVPPGRERSGYFISPSDPRVESLRRIFSEVSGRTVGIYGEYGGTDASALRRITTPRGDPMPVVVVGAMDETAHIHDAEESLDPRYFHEVIRLLTTWVERTP